MRRSGNRSETTHCEWQTVPGSVLRLQSHTHEGRRWLNLRRWDFGHPTKNGLTMPMTLMMESVLPELARLPGGEEALRKAGFIRAPKPRAGKSGGGKVGKGENSA